MRTNLMKWLAGALVVQSLVAVSALTAQGAGDSASAATPTTATTPTVPTATPTAAAAASVATGSVASTASLAPAQSTASAGAGAAVGSAVPVPLAAPGAPAKPIVRTCDDPTPKVIPADNAHYSVAVDTHTIWRPQGGEVTIIVTGQNNRFLSGLMLQTCFSRKDWGADRKFVAGGPITIEKADSQRVAFLTTVPDLREYDARYYGERNWWKRNVVERWQSLTNDSSLVPIAYVRVIGNSAQDMVEPLDVVLPIGITSVTAALLSTLLVVAWGIVVLRRFVIDRRGDSPGVNFVLTVIATKEGKASLSQFQMVLWTFVIGASAVYVILLSGNLIDISSDVQALLGITGITLLGAQLKDSQKGADAGAANANGDGAAGANAAAGAQQAGAQAPAQPAPAQQAPPQQAPAPAGVQAPPPGAAGTPDERTAPKWSDLVASGDGGIDVSRVQMFFFTVVSAIFVLLKVFGNYAIPELPSGYLVLMGISNGVYLANKFVPKP